MKNFCSNEWFFRFFQLSHIKRFVKLSCRQFQHLQFAGIFFTLLFLKVIPHLFRLTQKEKKERKWARETSNDKKREELRKRKKYYRKVCLRLRSSDSSNIGDQAGGKFHLLHHCSWWYIQFEFSYKFWLEPYEKNTAPGLEVILLDIFYYYMLYIIYIILSLYVIIYIFIQRNEKRKADSLVSRDIVVLILKINVNRIGCGSLKDKFRLFNLTMICFSLITFLWLLE